MHLRLAHNARYACLLESVEGGEKIARYTFVDGRLIPAKCFVMSMEHAFWKVTAAPPGCRKIPWITCAIAWSDTVPSACQGCRLWIAGAIGYFAYDMVRLIERIPDTTRDDVGMDDAVMMFFLGLVVFDHVRHRVWIVRNVFTDGEGSLRTKYNEAVREIQVPPRARLDVAVPSEPSQARRKNPARLRSLPIFRAPNSWQRGGEVQGIHSRLWRYFSSGHQPAALRLPKTDADPFEIYSLPTRGKSIAIHVFSETQRPGRGWQFRTEMLVKVQGREALYPANCRNAPAKAPMKMEDAALEAELAADPKEQAEHIMLGLTWGATIWAASRNMARCASRN